jgi:hypothetical protein
MAERAAYDPSLFSFLAQQDVASLLPLVQSQSYPLLLFRWKGCAGMAGEWLMITI